MDYSRIFEGLSTLLDSFSNHPEIAWTRIGLIFLGMWLVYLGHKGTLEPLLMVPMGLAMSSVNAGVLFLDPKTAGLIVNGSAALPDAAEQAQLVAAAAEGKMHGTLFMSPLVEKTDEVINLMQIDFLQPIFNFAFSNNLIACLVFMGIGVLLDVGFVLARPFFSVAMALFCELGTIAVYPIAVALGLTPGEAASIALVGGADGPMVLFGALKMAPHLLVPITIIAYLYLGLVYGGYPYLIRALIPEKLRAIKPPPRPLTKISSGAKLAFAVVLCTVLSFLFPVGAPLFFSLFLGVAVREAKIKTFTTLIENVFLYGATMFLGILLGVMCEASTILNPKVILLLVLGVLSLFLSGLGGIIGGYVAYLVSGRKINPVVAIAGVSCVPSTAKVAQKEVNKVASGVMILPEALGANIAGVITTAIITALYVMLISK
jgi:oxaloacetate decarboxylase beta subunit